MGQQFLIYLFFQYLAFLLRALLLSCFALNLLWFHQNAFLLLFWGMHSWDLVYCASRRVLMENISAWNTLNVPKDFGMHAVGPEIISNYLWEIWVGKALCGVSSTNIRGKEIYSFSAYRWCLILQKECDVSSARWFNTLVDFIAHLPMSCWNTILEHYFKIELLQEMESPTCHLRI